jgi:hypothetical protein
MAPKRIPESSMVCSFPGAAKDYFLVLGCLSQESDDQPESIRQPPTSFRTGQFFSANASNVKVSCFDMRVMEKFLG